TQIVYTSTTTPVGYVSTFNNQWIQGNRKATKREQHAAASSTNSGTPATRELRSFEQTLTWGSLAKDTAKSYIKQWTHFRHFVRRHNLPLRMPSTQQALSLYVCYLIKSGLAVSTVKTYLSAISFMHKISYMEDPTVSTKLTILCR
ncbi:uncharacterized protein LOC117123689, partial [Anneissia japonica]|uniref:uncharacterized protein LOC117123689 n=1 Tax=Anneissia japonica TaxID=1529436 RepID=UPI0014254D6E